MKRRASGCPICARPSVPAYRPFCSRRCGDIDLGRWLGGHFAIAAEPWNRVSDEAWASLDPLLPSNQTGARRVAV